MKARSSGSCIDTLPVRSWEHQADACMRHFCSCKKNSLLHFKLLSVIVVRLQEGLELSICLIVICALSRVCGGWCDDFCRCDITPDGTRLVLSNLDIQAKKARTTAKYF